MGSITRPRSQPSKRRAETEAAVLAAVKRLLFEGESFTELGINRIAKEAGVARSTFYLCFQDKTDVLIRLTGSMKDELFAIGAAWHPAGPGGGLEGLVAVFEDQLRFYRERAPLLAAITEVSAYDPALREATIQELERFAEHITGLIEEEQRAGRLSPDIDAVIASRVQVWGGEQAVARQVATGDPRDDTRFAREAAYSQWFGLYRRDQR
jgi:AcrR family transcriptional regulator